MRVVVDTNVFVSSFFGGAPRRIIDLWRRGDLVLCLSGEILDEYVAVARRLGLDSALLDELLRLLAGGVNMVFAALPPPVRVMQHDPDDDKLFACAVALKAGVIITGDKAVRAVGDYRDVRVRTPAEFLDELGAAGGR